MSNYYNRNWLVIVILLLATQAKSQTVVDHSTVPSPYQNWRANNFGQSFTIPAGSSCMDQLQVEMGSISPTTSAQFTIHSGNGTGGAAVYGPTAVTLTSGMNTFNFPGISVTPGQQYTYNFTISPGIYVFVVNGADSNTDSYTGGESFNNGTLTENTMSGSNYDDAFMVICATPLPVELGDFNIVEATEREVRLEWTTYSEYNNDFFIVEKSLDGMDWVTVAQVGGNGTTNESNHYNAIDDAPYTGVSFYRLKQVDFDGTVNHSKLISVDLKKETISVFPNPTNSKAFLNIPESPSEHYTIEITNGMGAKYHQTIFTQPGKQLYDIKNIENYTSGVYFVNVFDNTGGSVLHEKLIISH